MLPEGKKINNQTALTHVLTSPTPEALWKLRGELIEAGYSERSPVLVALDDFFNYLNDLMASSTGREYSHFASILDMAAVAGVAIQNLMNEEGSEDWWRRFIVGAVSEGLMVLAARQYVKAWEEEMNATYNAAAWKLAQSYWQLSTVLRPELTSEFRWRLVNELLWPIKDDELEGLVKAGLIVRYYQVLLLAWLNLPA